MPRLLLALAAALAVVLARPPAAAADEQPAPDAPGSASDVERARALFVAGAEQAAAMRWGEALDRFEESQKLRPHAGTTYNIGICQRALGRYTLARATFRRALAENDAAGGADVADSTVANIRGYLDEIAKVLATVTVTLAPASARIAVDGRPLEPVTAADEPPLTIAGTLPPGAGTQPPAKRFRIVLDPGAHVFVLARKGYSDVVLRHEVKPGTSGTLDIVLERLRGTLHVAASEDRAAVALDGVDVGAAPVTVDRPPGSYHVLVQKDGFDGYEADVKLAPGERTDMVARLVPEAPGVHEAWWFWATLAGSVATAAVVTYFVTRPEPERPPLDGGGLGWAIRVP